MTEAIGEQLISAGMSPEHANAKSKLFKSGLARLRSRDVPPDKNSHAFYVPGRIEFLGKHTDYAGGRSLICAVDRGFCIVASPRNDRLVRVIGETPDHDLKFEIDPELIPTAGHWSNYPMTVARRIARNFPGNLVGADIAFTGDLPASSGLSSSSALIIAFFLALSAANNLTDRAEYQENIHTATDLAGYLGTIENGQTFGSLTGDRGVGTFGGSEDHTAIVLGKPGQISQYSFCPVRFERAIAMPEEYSLVVGVSGVIAEKTGAAQADYNNASLAARKVLETWRNTTGRNDATLADAVAFDAAAVRRSLHDPRLIDRLDQFIAESTQIIPATGDAIVARDWNRLGELVDRSQALASALLKNQVPQTEFLQTSARELGAVAASSFGAGFGGSVWALIQSNNEQSFMAEWKSANQLRFPMEAARSSFFSTAAGVPATKVDVNDW